MGPRTAETVRLAPVLIQPIAADDVAVAVGRASVGEPVNGIVEVAGPEQFRLDRLIEDRAAAQPGPATGRRRPRRHVLRCHAHRTNAASRPGRRHRIDDARGLACEGDPSRLAASPREHDVAQEGFNRTCAAPMRGRRAYVHEGQRQDDRRTHLRVRRNRPVGASSRLSLDLLTRVRTDWRRRTGHTRLPRRALDVAHVSSATRVPQHRVGCDAPGPGSTEVECLRRDDRSCDGA